MKRLVIVVMFALGCASDGKNCVDCKDTALASSLCGAPAPACGDSTLLVAESDYTAPGHASVFDLGACHTKANVLALGEDPVLKRIGDQVYVLNREGATDADNVKAFAVPGLAPQGKQTSLGKGADPYDVAVGTDGRVYVAEFGGKGVGIVDLAQGQKTGEIDLSSLDPDGKPNPVALAVRGNTLYVVLGLLVDDNDKYTPRGPGKVAVVDLASSPAKLASTFALTGQNPTGWMVPEPGTDNMLIAMWNDLSGSGAGIERIDLAGQASKGFAITSDATDHRYIGDFAFTSDGTGYLLAFTPKSTPLKADLFRFDVKTGRTVGAAIFTGSSISSLAADGCGRLWISDQSKDKPGLRLIDGSGVQNQGRALPTALPPAFAQGMVFLP
jgi:hypothetical protein